MSIFEFGTSRASGYSVRCATANLTGREEWPPSAIQYGHWGPTAQAWLDSLDGANESGGTALSPVLRPVESSPRVTIPRDELDRRIVRVLDQMRVCFASEGARRLFGEQTSAVATVLQGQLGPAMSRLFDGQKTQRFALDESFFGKTLVKIHYSQSSIDVHLYKWLGDGSFKTVWGGLDCARTDVPTLSYQPYAYAKFFELHLLRARLKRLCAIQEKKAFPEQSWQHGAFNKLITETQEELSEMEAHINREVGLSSEIPRAVHGHIVQKNHPPGSIKGLLMEYVGGDTLFSYCKKNTLTQQQALTLAIQVTDIVAAVHMKGIAHMDVKPQNFLMRTTSGVLEPVLTDFGGATQCVQNSTQLCTSRISTYAAPEVVTAKDSPVPFNLSMDIWSLGLTLFEIAYGEKFRREIYNVFTGKTLDWLRIELLLLGHPNNFPRFNDVLEMCFQSNPAHRWSAERILAELKTIGAQYGVS